MECLEKNSNTMEALHEMKSPRLIKSHLPTSVLPTDLWKKQSKIIYVARKAKSSVLSAYHFYIGVGIVAKSTSIEEFVELFINGKLPYHPFWDHTLEFWEMRNQPNIFFTSYERMSQDIRSVIKDLCVFLGKPIPDQNVLDKAEKHLSFDSMKSEYEIWLNNCAMTLFCITLQIRYLESYFKKL